MAPRASKEVFAQRVSGEPGLAERLLDVVGSIPEPRERKHDEPHARARVVARKAAASAASTAGVMALPPGPLGWLTIAPELYAVWKLQAQMVADIAGVFGKRQLLSREQMLYCLFSHTAAGAFRQLVIRVGERYLVRRAPLSAMYAIANKVGIRIAQRSAGRMITRWVPALGALGVAGYVYYDTGKVADTSIELFESDVHIEGELEVEGVDALSKQAGRSKGSGRSAAAAGKRTAGAAARKPAAAGKKTAKNATKKTTKKSAKKSAKKAGTTAKQSVGKRTTANKRASSEHNGAGTRAKAPKQR